MKLDVLEAAPFEGTARECELIDLVLPVLREIEELEQVPYASRDREAIRALMDQGDAMLAEVDGQRRTTLIMVALRSLRAA